jgi:sugar/nucleoside kinase (ribokinase family)
MHERPFDVFGIGNALVDILAFVEDDLLSELQLVRGSMLLVDSAAQAEVLGRLEGKPLKLASGGSAANTMIAIAQSGGNGFYTGKVAHDPHGEFYQQDMVRAGIRFDVPLAPEAGEPTGSCVVLTTPDAERTMCTHLGVSKQLAPSDIHVDHLQLCKFAYIEGYLWDAEKPRAACVETMQRARRMRIPVAFTFSDAFLIDRFSDDFRAMTREFCDVLFCNADEARQFCGTDSLEQCAEALGGLVELVFLTNSENGCYVIRDGRAVHVPGFPIQPLDTVGAGDAFAGGVLFGLARGWSDVSAARWGNYIASRVVATNGPRLSESLTQILPSVITT